MIFFVLGTKFVVLRGERLASAGVGTDLHLAAGKGAGRGVGRGWVCSGALTVQGSCGGMTGCAWGARPPRGNTCSISKICRIFPDRRYCHEAGGRFGFTRPIFVPGTWYEVLGRDRCRAAARRAPARCRVWPVRAAPLRNTQCGSISSVSSRRDPGAPRLQNPHPPLRFRFAQPQLPVLRTGYSDPRFARIFNDSLLTAFGVLRHSARCARMQLGACGASHQVLGTTYRVLSTSPPHRMLNA